MCPKKPREKQLRREAVIRPLAGRPRLTVAAVNAAAEELGLKRARIYRLIAAYRAQAVAGSPQSWQEPPQRLVVAPAGQLQRIKALR
jgi:hypothetical protein